LCSLIQIFIIDGDDYKEAEFYFHFGKSHHPLVATSPELFVLVPFILQIDVYSFQKLLIVTHKIFTLDVEAPLVLHIFIGLHSKRLDT
jgi:hypothetical protein